MRARSSSTIALIVAMSLVLVSCTAGSEEPTTSTAQGQSTTEPSESEVTTTVGDPDAEVGTTYRIGVIASITGASFLGVPTEQTAEMMQARMDASGGIEGPDGVLHPVEIIVLDSESNPDTAAASAQRLINEDEVDVLVAGNLSGNALAIVPLATEAEVPMIALGSAGAIVADPDTGETREWIFKTPHANDMVAEAMLEYLEFIGTGSVCHLYENSGYGQDTLAQLETVLADTDISVAYSDSFERTDSEFPQVVSVTGAGCDVVTVGSVSPGAVIVAIAEALPDTPIVSFSGGCDPGLLVESAAGASEGVVLPCTPLMAGESLPEDNPNRDHVLDYIEDYTAATGDRPNGFGGQAYDALLWSFQAMETVDDGVSLEERRAAIRDWIETNVEEFPGTSGTYTITPDDHLGLDTETAFVYIRVEDGEFRYYPPEDWEN
jgi:branched-chain amino acid transport system substrate-binding protein